MEQDKETEEILAIFLEEAQDLMNAIAATLQKWSSDLNNKSCLAELKRDLHTLKGGARMVNQTGLSTLAHELESYCELIINDKLSLDKKAYDLVCEGQDRMGSIIEALSKKQTIPSVDDVIAKFKPEGAAVVATANFQPVKSGTKAEPETASPATAAVNTSNGKTNGNAATEQTGEHGAEIVRVKAELLEKLNNLSIEENILRANLGHHIDTLKSQIGEVMSIAKSLQEKLRLAPKENSLPIHSELAGLTTLYKNLNQIYANIDALLSQQSRIGLELQDRLVDTRMVPFNSVVPRLGRITRQLASELKKEIDFTVSQAEGEIDRNLLEHLIPSLEHLLRNAIDHGIEPSEKRRFANKPNRGHINLRFYRKGNDACLEISDDGAGIDPEAVKRKAIKLGLLNEQTPVSLEGIFRFILEPGFTTREQISEISGRGVGMDIVNTVVKGLGGNLSIESKLGVGTKFTIRLPFTTSVNRALLVVVQGQTYGILLSNVESIVLLNIKEVKEALNSNAATTKYHDKEYQLRYLGAALGLQDKPQISQTQQALPALLFNFSDFNAALLVDGLAGSQEVVVQSLGPQFKLMDIFSGATLLADGRVVIVLDAYTISSKAIKQVIEPQETKVRQSSQHIVMVVDDSVTIRSVTKNFLERHHYTVVTAKDGLDALDKMQKEKPDIILLDVEMPRMGGFEFAEKVRATAEFAKIPIIMITFVSGEEQRQRAAKLGIEKFLGKPYQEPELLESIERLLGAAG